MLLAHLQRHALQADQVPMHVRDLDLPLGGRARRASRAPAAPHVLAQAERLGQQVVPGGVRVAGGHAPQGAEAQAEAAEEEVGGGGGGGRGRSEAAARGGVGGEERVGGVSGGRARECGGLAPDGEADALALGDWRV